MKTINILNIDILMKIMYNIGEDRLIWRVDI